MLALIIVLMVLTTYFGTGTIYSRGRYANILAEYSMKRTDFKAIAEAKQAVAALDDDYNKMVNSTNSKIIRSYHSGGCDKSLYNFIGNCDCGATKKNRRLVQEHMKTINGTYDEPDVIKPILFWPGYVLTNFVKNGEPADKDLARRQKELAQAEHDAELAELRAREAAALDKELALSRSKPRRAPAIATSLGIKQ